MAPALGVAENCYCGGKLVVVDAVVDLLEDPSDLILLLDVPLEHGGRQLDAHLFQLELDTVAVCKLNALFFTLELAANLLELALPLPLELLDLTLVLLLLQPQLFS